jgi:hypothetical protein
MRPPSPKSAKLPRAEFPAWREMQVMPEWLTTGQLGILLGTRSDTVKHQIYRGIYRTARKMNSTRGLVWKVSVYDDAIPREIRVIYEKQSERNGAAHDRVDIESINSSLQVITELLREIAVSLRFLLERGK